MRAVGAGDARDQKAYIASFGGRFRAVLVESRRLEEAKMGGGSPQLANSSKF